MSVYFLPILILLSLLPGCSAERALEIALKDQVRVSDQEADGNANSNAVPLAMYERFLTQFRDRLENEWGEYEVVVPTRQQYVKYTQNYLSRAVVDFDQGIITIETLDNKNPLLSLREAAVTALLTPDDPNAVDLYSTSTVRLSERPFLYGLVLDDQNQPIDRKNQAAAFVRQLIAKQRKTRMVHTAAGRKTLYSVSMEMVNNHANIRARRYAPFVDRYAAKYGMSKSLIYAVMKTESNFNAFAVSTAPAYGLMQLVPASGGRDAYRLVTGKDAMPSRDYLFQPEQNIELGTAYLSLLDREYLKDIRDSVSREYCMISAYNGGVGTMLRVFSNDPERAIRVINGLSPGEVNERLRTRHPYEETRNYLVRVVSARKQFVNL